MKNSTAFVIMFQRGILDNVLFRSDKEARNYIKMRYSNRSFKEPKENVFICKRYGTTFTIVELKFKDNQDHEK